MWQTGGVEQRELLLANGTAHHHQANGHSYGNAAGGRGDSTRMATTWQSSNSSNGYAAIAAPAVEVEPAPFHYKPFQEQLQHSHPSFPPPLQTTAVHAQSNGNQHAASRNGYATIPLTNSPVGGYAHKAFSFSQPAAVPTTAATSGGLQRMSPDAAAAAAAAYAPFHSYPHIAFRLPDSFSEEAEAIWAPVAPVVPVPPEPEPQQPSPTPQSPYVPSLANAPFQSLLPMGSTAVPRSGGSSPLPRPPPASVASALQKQPRRRFHLSFRAMHRTDLQRVARLHEALFPVRYDDRFYASLLSSHSVTLLAFLECDDSDARVAGAGASDRAELLANAPASPTEREPVLVGLATGRCREESSTCRRSHSGYITTLGVDARFRRLGLGRFLLKHVVRLLRELDPRIERVVLDVKEDNAAAVAMYKACGFQVAARLFDHYHIDGRDYNALQMQRWIDLRKSIYDDDELRKGGWCAVM